MPNYRYDARNKNGEAFHGTLQVENEAQAVLILQSRELIITKISVQADSKKTKNTVSRHRGVKPKDLLFPT